MRVKRMAESEVEIVRSFDLKGVDLINDILGDVEERLQERINAGERAAEGLMRYCTEIGISVIKLWEAVEKVDQAETNARNVGSVVMSNGSASELGSNVKKMVPIQTV